MRAKILIIMAVLILSVYGTTPSNADMVFEEADNAEMIETEQESVSEPEIKLTSGINIEKSLTEAGEIIEDEPEPESTEEGEEAEATEPTSEPALLPNEAIVKNFSELEKAIKDSKITTIYFDADIELTKGITVNPAKEKLIISGINPYNPNQTSPYTFTDVSSVDRLFTINVGASGPENIHVRDLNIVGRNFYSPIGVEFSANVNVTYERVNYNGPQISYNKYGTTCFIDCDIEIHGRNGGSRAEEIFETKHAIFEGKNTISSSSTTNSLFWHTYGGSFKIADNSSVTVVSQNTNNEYCVFFADASSYRVDIEIGENSILDITTSEVLINNTFGRFSSILVKEDGVFNLKTTASDTRPVILISGPLIVDKGGQFVVSGIGGTTQTLLSQGTGYIKVEKDAVFQLLADTPYSSLINMSGQEFWCNDPANVLLYNGNKTILSSSININAQQVNYWDRTTSGDLDNPPLYKWNKINNENFTIGGTLNASGSISNIHTNYAPEDTVGPTPTSGTFSFVNARTLAVGRLELTIAEPTTQSKSINGITAPYAVVRVSLTQNGTDYTYPDAIADKNGIFRVPIDIDLESLTVVNVLSNWNYLTTSAEAIVQSEGELEFFVPSELEFLKAELSATKKIIGRLDHNWKIVVSDTRGSGSGWSIYARLEKEMTPDSANRDVLYNSLVFFDDAGYTHTLRMDTDTLISSHVSEEDEDVFPVVWDYDKGILLAVNPGAAFTDTTYSGIISWTLLDAP